MVGAIAAGAAGGSMLDSLFGMIGANQQNIANARMASAQMEFQREMRDTAHQAEVKDLKAAGLNPILSAGGGGAAVPSGASAAMQNVAGNTKFGDAVVKGIEALKTRAETEAVKASALKATADAETSRKTGELIDIQKLEAGARATAAQNALPRSELFKKAWDYVGSAAKGMGPSAAEDFANAVRGVVEGVKNSAMPSGTKSWANFNRRGE